MIKEEIKQRFWEKVEMVPFHDCWEWTAALVGKGYGYFNAGERLELAHRFSYELRYGKIPSKMHILHSCDNKTCVNPRHLSIGTNSQNVQDMVNKGRSFKKMSLSRIAEIREKYKTGKFSQQALGNQYGVSQTVISYYVRGLNSKDRRKC